MNWSLCGSSNPIIAGDGYAYVSYGSAHTDYSSFPGIAQNSVQVLRVSSGGGSQLIPLTSMVNAVNEGQCEVSMIGMIANADQGVLVNWGTMVPSAPTSASTYIWSGGMAITSGGGVSTVSTDDLWGNMYPVLQAQDGSFVGEYFDEGTNTYDIAAFGQGGGIRWTVPNDYPMIATADGGVIGYSGITYDQNGIATGMVETPIYSWKGNAYEVGSVDQVFMPWLDFALSFGAFGGGNPSGNGTYVKLVQGKVFIPFEIAAPGNPPQTNSFAATLNGRYNATKMAVAALPSYQAKASGFLDALKITNSVVAYIDHGISLNETPFNAVGLCFAGFPYTDCLAPTPLITITTDSGSQVQVSPPVGESWDPPLPNGFAPKAKVVILAACGITNAFINQWHLSAKGQALIVPVYDPGSNNQIDLGHAAADVELMLDQLSSWNNVGATVNLANSANGGKAGYTWTVIPEAGRDVGFN
jgi:hypothetical protein